METNKIYRVTASPTSHWYAVYNGKIIREEHSLKRAQGQHPAGTKAIVEIIDYITYQQFHLPIRIKDDKTSCTCGNEHIPNPTQNPHKEYNDGG
jgi:hypothetical protein